MPQATLPAVGRPNTQSSNTGSSLASEPRREWWYRENPQDALSGPFDYRQAENLARRLSRRTDRSGLAELCTYVAAPVETPQRSDAVNTTRGGDPRRVTPKLFVVYMYIRGKRTLGGRTAEYHSSQGLPPTS